MNQNYTLASRPLRLDLADQRVKKRKYGMPTMKRKAIRKAAPLLGAAATAGLFSMTGTAMAGDISAQSVSQIVLSDDAEVTFVGWNNGHSHSIPARIRRAFGKGGGGI